MMTVGVLIEHFKLNFCEDDEVFIKDYRCNNKWVHLVGEHIEWIEIDQFYNGEDPIHLEAQCFIGDNKDVHDEYGSYIED